MARHEEMFAGHNDTPLFEQAWLPEGLPRAVIVHVHGLLEHSGRYAMAAEAAVGQGYAVYAMDLRGHGRSNGPRCDVESFDHYLFDLDVFISLVRARQPDQPIFLMGNSMGGLIATLWAIRTQIEQLPAQAALLQTPLLILHGSRDRICGPAGSRMLCERAGSVDKTLRMYSGLCHEVFDEPEREQVLADLTAWLNGHTKERPTEETTVVYPESRRG